MSTTKKLTESEAKAVLDAEAKSKAMDFEWSYSEEPHATRRKMILADHPEIQKLFGHNTRSKYYAAATVFLQLFMGYYVAKVDPTMGWGKFLLLSYFIGGTCNHSLTLAIHEISHMLFFKKNEHNKLYGLFCNFPLLIPYTISFREYHMDHHRMQGVDGMDTDIPTVWEGHFFTTPLRKALWVMFQPFFYAIRPLVVNPKPLTTWHFLNIATQLSFVGATYSTLGSRALLYYLASTFLGLGCHFCAGHFIAEHYTTLSSNAGPHKSGLTAIKRGDQKTYVDETFTYRGPLNMLSYNVGVHVAHHDFPFVSGLRLYELEKMAPEYYEHLPVTTSWPGTTLKYIFSDACPFDRVKRHTVEGGQKSDSKKAA